jgi:cell division protein FtsL
VATTSVTAPAEAVAAADRPVAGARRHWNGRHTAAVVALLAAIAGVGIALPWAAGASGAYNVARLTAWLAMLGLFGSLAVVFGDGLTGLRRGVFVDERNKLSLSRVQLFLWTTLVLSAYLCAALANAGLGAAEPLAVAVPEPLWLAMGVSTSSLVAAPLVLHRAKGKAVDLNKSPSESHWTDLVRAEERGFVDVVDLGKLQLLLVTIVLVVAYGVVVAHAYLDDRQVVTSLPRIDDAFVIMLAISHAGYLAKKTVPRPHQA